jgi:ABC-type amino acid transport substrate-binding protein
MHRPPRFSTALAAIGVLVALALPPAAAASSPTLARIKERGSIVFSYRHAAPPFSYRDREGRVKGYSVDLCLRVAALVQKELGLKQLQIEWVSVEAATRLDAVASGKVDADCGTTTISLSRMEKVDFSVPIYVDGGGVLVRTQKKPMKLADLKGKRIAVIPGTTTEAAITKMLDSLSAPATLVPVTNGPEGMALLERGEVDGYAGDRVVLANLKLRSPKPSALMFVGGDFSYEPYGIVLRRDDPDFKLAVNRAIVGLYRTGDIDAIFQHWLGAMGRPGTLLNAMFYLNTLPE